jgi:hypothetical protein
MGNSHKNFSSETTGPIATKLWWNGRANDFRQEDFYENFP